MTGPARRRLLLAGALGAAGLCLATFPPGAPPATWAAALLLVAAAILGVLLGAILIRSRRRPQPALDEVSLHLGR